MQFDALLVIHQDINLGRLGIFCQEKNWKKIFLLTSHYLLPFERNIFADNYSHSYTTTPMAFFIDEMKSDICDNVASEYVLTGKISALEHSKVMLLLKNIEIRKSILQMHSFYSIHIASGLGIFEQVWLEGGALRLAPQLYYGNYFPNISILCTDDTRYIFFSSLRRLNIIKDYKFDTFIFPWQSSECAEQGQAALISSLYSIIGIDEHRQDVVAGTIHDYSGFFHRFGLPVCIFLDGYHPPNYNRTYIDNYENVTFMASEPVSAGWFRRFSYPVMPAPCFIRQARMPEVWKEEISGTILLALNHAGDWSALINRSDTDILVMAFSELAATFPHLTFVLRPHPTMNKAAHEGKHSLARITEYVVRCALPNLKISSNTDVMADIEESFLVCSEYSQVLITGWLSGICGLSVNITRRRSFMQPYVGFGFPEVSSLKEWEAFIAELLCNKEIKFKQQIAAAKQYNIHLDEFYQA
jgi:hypothetical protein